MVNSLMKKKNFGRIFNEGPKDNLRSQSECKYFYNGCDNELENACLKYLELDENMNEKNSQKY